MTAAKKINVTRHTLQEMPFHVKMICLNCSHVTEYTTISIFSTFKDYVL